MTADGVSRPTTDRRGAVQGVFMHTAVFIARSRRARRRNFQMRRSFRGPAHGLVLAVFVAACSGGAATTAPSTGARSPAATTPGASTSATTPAATQIVPIAGGLLD